MPTDCILIEHGRAHEIIPGVAKVDLPPAHPDWLAKVVEVPAGTVAAGDVRDGDAFTTAVPVVNTIIQGGVFLARVIDAEYLAVVTAANTAFAGGDPTMLRWLELVRVNGFVNTESGTAIEAKAALVAAGLLTQERADLIFATA